VAALILFFSLFPKGIGQKKCLNSEPVDGGIVYRNLNFC